MKNILSANFEKNGSENYDGELKIIENEIKNMVVKLVINQTGNTASLDDVEATMTKILNKVRKEAKEELFENQDITKLYCQCGEKMKIKEKLPRTITGLVDYNIRRRSFHCSVCDTYQQPLDQLINCPGGYTLEIKKALSLLGQRLPFLEASDYLKKLLKVHISHDTFQTRRFLMHP